MFCSVLFCSVLFCSVMLCYVMLCYVMLCYVMLCYVMLCYVLFGFVLFYFLLSFPISRSHTCNTTRIAISLKSQEEAIRMQTLALNNSTIGEIEGKNIITLVWCVIVLICHSYQLNLIVHISGFTLFYSVWSHID